MGGFRKTLDHVADSAPLRKNVTIEDVGNAGAFLYSAFAAGITGKAVHVDAGTVGMADA